MRTEKPATLSIQPTKAVRLSAAAFAAAALAACAQTTATTDKSASLVSAQPAPAVARPAPPAMRRAAVPAQKPAPTVAEKKFAPVTPAKSAPKPAAGQPGTAAAREKNPDASRNAGDGAATQASKDAGKQATPPAANAAAAPAKPAAGEAKESMKDAVRAAIRPKHDTHGVASFYRHGTTTANGEKFDTSQFTAAHRTLPFGTRLRVTNLATGRSVLVRVNDRGPFIDGRVVDVTYAAAESLGFTRNGLAKVRLDVIR